MKISDKALHLITGLILFFLFNFVVSLLCMLFLDITPRQCLLYSITNALWMQAAVPPVMKRFHFFNPKV